MVYLLTIIGINIFYTSITFIEGLTIKLVRPLANKTKLLRF